MTTPIEKAIQDILNKMTMDYAVSMNTTAIQIGAQGIGLPLAISIIVTAALHAAINLRRTAELHGHATGGDAFTREMFEVSITAPIHVVERNADDTFSAPSSIH